MGLEHSRIKAVLCMDLDGTLIDHDESAHPRDIEILNHFPEEVLPVLATGRSLPSAKGVFKQNGILTEGPLPLASVVMNGTAVQLPGEEIIKLEYLESTLLKDLLQLPALFPSTAFFFYQPADCYLINPTEAGRKLSNLHYLNASESSPEGIPPQINKVMAVDKNLATVEQIRRQTQSYAAEMGTSLPYILEFSPLGITKAKGVQFLLAAMGLNSLPIFAVGDGENDLTLKSMVQRFFTPNTAQSVIQQQADCVIDRAENGLLAPVLAQIL